MGRLSAYHDTFARQWITGSAQSRTRPPLLDAVAAARPLGLIQRGADVNVFPQKPDERRLKGGGGHSSSDGRRWWPLDPICEPALTLAAKADDQDMAELLIRHGAMVTPNSDDTVGTPLLYAVRDQNTDPITALLDKGADPSQHGTIVKKDKPTFPLLVAAEKGDNKPDLLTPFLKAGSSANEQDSEGFSALHVAASSRVVGSSSSLKSLPHTRGANMNLRLLNGSLPIHSAASRGTPKNVGILLDAGAGINTVNDTGRTLLHWTADNSNWETIEYLLDCGAWADVKAHGDEGANTPVNLTYLARRRSIWARRTFSRDRKEERIDRLLRRLKDASSVGLSI